MDSLDLSRRAVAAGWRWQAGALVRTDTSKMRIDGADVDGKPVRYETRGYGDKCACYVGWRTEEVLPDFHDPATRGVMLQQVRERWDAPTICTDCDGLRWSVVRVDGTVLAYGDSETAALVCALEAAPKR